MTFKTKVCDEVSKSVSEFGGRVHDLVERVDDARDALSDWGYSARRIMRRNPAAVIAGAFALGFGLAMLTRRRGRAGQ